MENRFDFFPGSLVVNGKTFPAVYESMPGRVVISAETADGQKKIEIPETDARYMLAYAVADETARKAAQQAEPAQDPEKRPETISEPVPESSARNYTWYSALGNWREYGPTLADGKTPFTVWFTPGVATHYDEIGALTGREEMPVPDNAVAADAETKRPETILPDNAEKEEEKTMPVYEIGYDAGVCFSINMIQAPDEETARAAAEKHAARHGYSVAYVKELFAWQVKENREKGMPFETVTEKPAPDPESSAPAADADAAQEQEERPETISEPAPESSADADAADVADALRPVAELRKHDSEKADKYEKLIRKAMKANAETPAQDPAPAAVPAPETKRPETILKASPVKPPRGPAKEKDFAGESITGKGWSIVFDTGLNRTRVIVSEPVRETLRPIIEAAGFYYSNAQKSWNKKLTHKAHKAAVSLADNLRAALA